MDVPYPGSPYAAELVGSAWPEGSEEGMSAEADILEAHARALVALDANVERGRTDLRAVLAGDTQLAADAAFAQLFDGESSVPKLGEALGGGLGGAAQNMGDQLWFTKANIDVTVAVAGAWIVWYVATGNWEFIPVIAGATEQTIGRVLTQAAEGIGEALVSALSKTMVKRLLVEGAVSAVIGAGQDAALQVLDGRRTGIDVGEVVGAGASMGAAGVAGALTGHEIGQLLGHGDSLAERAVKGALSGLGGAVAGNVVGTVAGGGGITPQTIWGGALGFVHGALHGAHGAHGTGGRGLVKITV